MGVYFNPSNVSFTKDIRSEVYIDKTELLNVLNKRLFTKDNCVCVTHARRFGKSQAADLIAAYYSRGCDSRELLSKYKIAESENWTEYINKFNVVKLDISTITDNYKDDLIEEIIARIYRDIENELSENIVSKVDFDLNIELVLSKIYEITEIPFIIIIDEWDSVLRAYGNDDSLVHQYMTFLHTLFKSAESKNFLALGYITGIIPIKKIENESALNNFQEYTMLRSGEFTPYYGFTEDEVYRLCQDYDMDMESIKKWYNGYMIDGIHMYNPNSVCRALQERELDSYWRNTSAYTTINKMLRANYGGLRDDIINMLAGEKIYVDTRTFQNDLLQLNSKYDVMTALIHLGYLGYDREAKSAYIPNYEVASAFEAAISYDKDWGAVGESIAKSEKLLQATLNMNEKYVATALDLAHDAYTSVFEYNDENSLSCVLTMAYFSAQGYYNIVRELATGKGYADFAFIPLINTGNRLPMIIELKWNRSANTAIKQIKENRYVGKLSDYKEILLVGINYNKKNKKHSCKIEKYCK